ATLVQDESSSIRPAQRTQILQFPVLPEKSPSLRSRCDPRNKEVVKKGKWIRNGILRKAYYLSPVVISSGTASVSAKCAEALYPAMLPAHSTNLFDAEY